MKRLAIRRSILHRFCLYWSAQYKRGQKMKIYVNETYRNVQKRTRYVEIRNESAADAQRNVREFLCYFFKIRFSMYVLRFDRCQYVIARFRTSIVRFHYVRVGIITFVYVSSKSQSHCHVSGIPFYYVLKTYQYRYIRRKTYRCVNETAIYVAIRRSILHRFRLYWSAQYKRGQKMKRRKTYRNVHDREKCVMKAQMMRRETSGIFFVA